MLAGMRRERLRDIAFIAVVAIVLASCGPPLIAVPTINDIPHTCTEEVTGILVDEAGWGLGLRNLTTVDQLAILWPNGFSAIDEGDRIALVDQDHRVVARTGDAIRATGDLVGTGTLHVICGDIKVVAH